MNDDPITKWTFECLADPAGKPPAGGLVLQQIKHDYFNFAKDVRVIGFWIATELVDPSGKVTPAAPKFYTLDNSNFTVSTINTITPKPLRNPSTGNTFNYLKEGDAALQFGEYFKKGENYSAYGVSATYDAPALLDALTNCEYAGLTVEQIFLLSPYANTPPHEPGGNLQAARFHPLIRYRFSTNSSYDDTKQFTRVSSIRFDYRLHLFVDRPREVASNARLKQLGNQAALFADSDTALTTPLTIIGSALWNILNSNTWATAVSRGLFDAAEKPLLFEVTAPGLAKGFSRFRTLNAGGSPVDVRCWDNLHWWGTRGPGEGFISAPGAFHNAHTHWRWGGALALAGKMGDPRFNPITWPAGMPVAPAMKGMWGPLVDPGIWIQTLRIAVVKNDPRIDPNRGVALPDLSRNDWASLFTDRPPVDISAGNDDIVFWYSVEVHRDVTVSGDDPNQGPAIRRSLPKQKAVTYRSAGSGVIFIHGIFFAHDPEQIGNLVGSTGAEYRPNDKTTIRRLPSKEKWFRSASRLSS
ncbi:hypothetical protein [Paraburkholderia dipogonis]|uniref:hypothetical protein n=1 Tax=Paraburkholderia dipogonis TaxID=1211383 RepID=UPI0038BDA72B